MSSNEFDLSELDDFASEMLKLINDTMPKESAKFLRTEGTKLRKVTLAKAKSLVKKRVSGNYYKGIKRGKVYKYEGDQQSIRVYGSSHAHLLEYGHRMVTHDGQEVGFVKGYRIFEKAAKDFEHEYLKDCEDFIDSILDKGLR